MVVMGLSSYHGLALPASQLIGDRRPTTDGVTWVLASVRKEGGDLHLALWGRWTDKTG